MNVLSHLRPELEMLLTVRDLVVEYRAGRHRVHAVSDISFDVQRGETLGIVGESGCGKSSTGRAIMQLPRPTSGSVRLSDLELTSLAPEALRAVRPRMQMVFQDPSSSLNPRHRVRSLVHRGLELWDSGAAGVTRVDDVLRRVGLDPNIVGERRPGQLSGGQAQRVAIARSLILNPELLICDEPVSALDVSVQAQILNLLREIRDEFSLTMVFISHDLAVVRNMCDRVVVMYLGKICEIGSADRLYASPAHHYSQLLLNSVPDSLAAPDGRRRRRVAGSVAGDLPSPMNPPSGCRFRTRCERAETLCAEVDPPLRTVDDDHFVACHFPLSVGRRVMSEATAESTQNV